MQESKCWRGAIIKTYDRELLARSLSQFRRAMLRDFLFSVFRTFTDFEFSLPQVATLILLEEGGAPTIKQVAEYLGRSVSTVSRLVDQLVEQGLVTRREDENDRRNKRLAITEKGRSLIATVEERRLDAQLKVMDYLSAQEQAEVIQGMVLLAEASARRRANDHSEVGAAGKQPD